MGTGEEGSSILHCSVGETGPQDGNHKETPHEEEFSKHSPSLETEGATEGGSALVPCPWNDSKEDAIRATLTRLLAAERTRGELDPLN